MFLFLAFLTAANAVFANTYTKFLADEENSSPPFWNIAVSSALTAVFVIMASVNVVAPGTNQVVTLYGSVNPKPLEAGVHLINPLASFIDFDLRQAKEDINDITLQTQDKLISDIDISIIYQAVAASTPTTYVESGTLPQAVEKHMIPAIRSIIREVGRSIPLAQDLANSDVQSRMQTEIESKLNDYLAPKGFKVFDVLMRDINLPQVVKQAVVNTKEREQQIETEKAQLKIIEQKAQQQVVQAQALEQAAVATANAVRTKADAEAYRILTEARATADGNKEIAKSLTKEIVSYTEANRWNGVLPSTALTGTMPIINVK